MNAYANPDLWSLAIVAFLRHLKVALRDSTRRAALVSLTNASKAKNA